MELMRLFSNLTKKLAIHSFLLEKVEMDLDLTEEEIHGLLNSVSHSCEEMLVQCKFEGIERNCMEIFSPTITDDGQCCGFNVMPEHVMFRNKDDHGTEEEWRRWSGWSIQEGYNQKPDKGRPDCEQGDITSSVNSLPNTICTLEDGSPPR